MTLTKAQIIELAEAHQFSVYNDGAGNLMLVCEACGYIKQVDEKDRRGLAEFDILSDRRSCTVDPSFPFNQ
jgi:hypothetical protein